MKIRKQILIPLLLVDAIALYFFLTTIEFGIFWFAPDPSRFTLAAQKAIHD